MTNLIAKCYLKRSTFRQIDDLYRCVGNVVNGTDVCGVFGSRFLKDAVTFVKSHLTCSAPKGEVYE